MLAEEPVQSEATQTPKEAVPDAGLWSFPPSVYFIIGNEFCERFCYYGMKTILPVYLTARLRYSEDASTTIIHSFNFAAYSCTLFGGILSDSWLGKFWTILGLSVVYCMGSSLLAFTAFHADDRPRPWGCFLGLALLALGTGGIKPCVASFGGDQLLRSPGGTLALFFSVFYFTINAGSVLSMLVTPILRSHVHCFGQESCYPLAFGLPAVLMVVATAILLSGRQMYNHVRPQGNVVLKVVGASVRALSQGRRPSSGPVEHWLDRAQPWHHPVFIEDCKRLFRILAVFSPICLFWALYDQQSSRWTYQAMMMDPRVDVFGVAFAIKPEQMGLANAFLILAMIPLFNKAVYPLLRGLGVSMRPLSRMLCGMVLGAASFVLAAVLQFAIVRRGVFSASPDNPQSRVCIRGCVHVLAQVPQYILITAGEVMFSITGLEFAYNQAPASMKSVCQAAWLLTVAAGNLVVVLFNEFDPIRGMVGGDSRHLQTWNFLLWALLLAIGIAVFSWLARGYRYVEGMSVDGMSVEGVSVEAVSPQ